VDTSSKGEKIPIVLYGGDAAMGRSLPMQALEVTPVVGQHNSP
jgi:hypothetical protein